MTTDCGSSDDERNGAKPPEHDIPVDAHRDSAAAFVASPLTCDEESLCAKSRRKANETFVQTINTGVPGRDLDLKVMFDAKLPRTLISYEAASDAALNPSGGEKFVVGADVEVDWSECRYTVPLVDSGGRTRWLKARGWSTRCTPARQSCRRTRLRCSQKWLGHHQLPISGTE